MWVSVRVNFVGTFRQEVQQSELLLSFKTAADRVRLRDVIQGLEDKGIKLEHLDKAVVLIDGKNAYLIGGLDAEIVHGATVIIMSFAGGG